METFCKGIFCEIQIRGFCVLLYKMLMLKKTHSNWTKRHLNLYVAHLMFDVFKTNILKSWKRRTFQILKIPTKFFIAGKTFCSSQWSLSDSYDWSMLSKLATVTISIDQDCENTSWWCASSRNHVVNHRLLSEYCVLKQTL